MVGVDVHALTQIEAMGCISLNTGVKIDGVAAELSSPLGKGVEEFGSVAAVTLSRGGGEIINVKLPYRTGVDHNAPTGHGNTALLLEESREAEALLPAFHDHPVQKFRRQVGAQFLQYWEGLFPSSIVEFQVDKHHASISIQSNLNAYASISTMRALTAYLEEGVTLALSMANALSTYRQGVRATYQPSVGTEQQDAVTSQDISHVEQQLRDVLTGAAAADASKKLNELLHEAAAAPILIDDGQGRWRLHLHSARATTISRLTVKAAAGLAALMDDDEWTSIKQCAASHCDDYFLDRSRNHSRRFCSRTCANRINAHLYRTRTESPPIAEKRRDVR